MKAKNKSRKKSLGSAARYGPRYSTPLKTVVRDIEKVERTAQVCPQCGREALKRRGNAKWTCTKCGYQMAGGAYTPQTSLGRAVDVVVKKGGSKKEMLEEIKAILEEEKQEA